MADPRASPTPTDSTTSGTTSSSPPSSPTSVARGVSSDAQNLWRARRRVSERKSREKRKTTFERMHQQIQVLECAVANVPYALADPPLSPSHPPASDSDSPTDAMRDFLRRSHTLAQEATQLRAENHELTTMMEASHGAVQTLRQLTQGMRVDAWSQSVERWNETTRSIWTDWTLEACTEILQDSMRKIQRFSFYDAETETTGMSFLGWRDRRRLETATATIHFSFTKTYYHMDAEDLACGYWNMHMDSAQYARCMLGPNVQCYYEIIQHVSPDICIVRCVEQYPNLAFKVHMLFLIFRVRTSTGFIQCLRSIPCPELQRATLDEDAYWTTNFHWVHWETIKATGGVRSSVNGSIASSTVDYANRWMGEAILTLVRAESILLGRNLLKL